MSQKCKGCKYYRTFCGQTKACHYAIDMLDLGNYGELRGSSVEDCTHNTNSKYKPVSIQLPKERKKKELKFNLTQAIDMYISGMKLNQIAKQIGISQQLLNYHIQRYRSDVVGGSNV